MTSFQYISDLHIEFYTEKNPFDIQQCAEYLLLGGDIGNPFLESYRLFLENVSKRFNKIFIISGNHEYYKNYIDETDTQIRYICSLFSNVIFLQNESYTINNNLKIFGTTLWSYIPSESEDIILSSISDYNFIKNFKPSISNNLHQIAVNALENEINNSEKNINYIVLSHHIPLLNLIPQKYKYCGEINHAFASDLNIAKSEKIKAWVYGHTHTVSKIDKYYCNPVGYPDENKYWSMNETFTI